MRREARVDPSKGEAIMSYIIEAIATPSHRPMIEKCTHSIFELIDKYSEPTVWEALGRRLEGLVKAELRAQGFRIVGAHTATYGGG